MSRRTTSARGGTTSGGSGGGGDSTTTAARVVPPNVSKRADKRSTITILVLGDEGVGKSSLISTFVSRYFSEVVPGIMTRVRLPPDPETSCITTIVDSQGGDAALLAAVQASMSVLQLGTSSGTSSGGSTPGGGGVMDSLAFLMQRAEAGGSVRTPTRDSSNQQQQPTTPGSKLPTTKDATSTSMTSSSSTTGATGAALTPGIENVDSIILVYDLDRVETFFRLENHWLPLIERCYRGKVPVIVAENKMDLFRPSSTVGATDEQALARKRQQIVSLMQRFPFVRQCIKCSAKNLLRVDDIFLKAQQAVLYPFTPPLYDLENGRLTVECKRALTRIFRMYDSDHDGLLSDAELDRFQRETYHVSVLDRDLAAWKKVVQRNNPSADEVVIQDGKFTVPGFWAIFDLFISQNRLDVVWQCFRKFGYDDDLNLHVPESVMTPINDGSGAAGGGAHDAQRGAGGGGSSGSTSSWKLSSPAKKFLAALFYQFDSDKDGIITASDVQEIFSILPPLALPPWHPLRARDLFRGCFSLPKPLPIPVPTATTEFGQDSSSLIVPAAGMSQSLSSSGISLLSANDLLLPSVGTVAGGSGGASSRPMSKSLTFLEWMGHWHMISAISPDVTRAELFRLGHVEDIRRKPSSDSMMRRRSSRKKKQSVGPVDPILYDSTLKSREIRVLVLGSHSCGKTALLNALCGTFDGFPTIPPTQTTSTARPETSSAHVKLRRKFSIHGNGKSVEEGEEFVVHLVFTDVPETAAASQEEHYRQLSELFGLTTSPKDRVCDLAMLVFDCTKASSLSYVKELESTLLTKETPRVFVGTKADLFRPPEPEDGDVHPATVLDAAEIHCRQSDLEAPLLISASDQDLRSRSEKRLSVLDHLARCALMNEPGVHRLKSLPHEEQKRREAAKRRKLLWLGSIVSVGVVVVVGVGLLWGHGSSTAKSSKDQSSSQQPKSNFLGFGWLRSWFGSGTGYSTSTAAAREVTPATC